MTSLTKSSMVVYVSVEHFHVSQDVRKIFSNDEYVPVALMTQCYRGYWGITFLVV